MPSGVFCVLSGEGREGRSGTKVYIHDLFVFKMNANYEEEKDKDVSFFQFGVFYEKTKRGEGEWL